MNIHKSFKEDQLWKVWEDMCWVLSSFSSYIKQWVFAVMLTTSSWVLAQANSSQCLPDKDFNSTSAMICSIREDHDALISWSGKLLNNPLYHLRLNKILQSIDIVENQMKLKANARFSHLLRLTDLRISYYKILLEVYSGSTHIEEVKIIVTQIEYKLNDLYRQREEYLYRSWK